VRNIRFGNGHVGIARGPVRTCGLDVDRVTCQAYVRKGRIALDRA